MALSRSYIRARDGISDPFAAGPGAHRADRAAQPALEPPRARTGHAGRGRDVVVPSRAGLARLVRRTSRRTGAFLGPAPAAPTVTRPTVRTRHDDFANALGRPAGHRQPGRRPRARR